MNNFDTREQFIKKTFANDETLLHLDILKPGTEEIFCKLFFLDGISDTDKISETIVKPLKENMGKDVFITNPKVQKETDLDKVTNSLLTGSTIILFPNNNDIYIVDTRKPFIRGIAEPMSEITVKGPRDGFLENLIVNITLIRNHLKNKLLKVKYIELNDINHAKIAILYLDGIVNYHALEMVQKRIEEVKKTIVLDANNLKEELVERKFVPVGLIGDTQRPDKACKKLMQGKIVILVDGSPVSLYLPFTFKEYFQTLDDDYVNYVYATINRIIRFVCFSITILISALYIALIIHHQEILPSKLVMSIIASRKGVPFPTTVECIIFLGIYEILREAGSKTNSMLGSALSIVGALIIGQTAVEARLISMSMVIIVAVSSVTALVNPKLSGLQLLLRLVFIFLASFLGIQGILIGFILCLTYFLNLKSFGEDYIKDIMPVKLKKYSQTYARLPNANEK